MKLEGTLLIGVGIFFGIVGLIYWIWSSEDAGGLMLLGTTLLGLVPGSYYLWWHRRIGYRPEDRDDATIEDGAGVVNTFPGSSIWPFVIGVGAFFTLLALVFGAWLIFIGISLILIAAVGDTAESRRGGSV
jgi:hypothetical protein